ncbi:MAG: hypothetical protein PHV59_02030 [Victivallales bacterium]|nr:hypothetical protein [Victivallales bacterium]
MKENLKMMDQYKIYNGPVPMGLPETPKILHVKSWIGGRFYTEPEEIVEYAKEVGFNVINITIGRNLGPILYPTKYRFDDYLGQKSKSRAVHEDYIPRLIKKCQQYGIQVWANFFCNAGAVPLYDNEKAVDQHGKAVRHICPLRGKEYMERLTLVLKEFLTLYPYINAVTLDEPQIKCAGGKRKWCCFCTSCKEKFKHCYGEELTPQMIEDARFMEFREKICVTDYLKPIAEAINAVNPRVKLIPCGYPGAEYWGLNFQKVSDEANVDIFGWEYIFALKSLGNNEYYCLDDDNRRDYLNMNWKGLHRIQHFQFDRILADKNSETTFKTLFNNIPRGGFKGRGVKLSLFNKAQVIAWMGNGKNSYPAVVSAHNGRTFYISFGGSLEKR